MMVSILDTTLREGEQTPGVCFPEHVKLKIASLLDKIGVAFIEAGHPAVSSGIYNSVKMLTGHPFTSLVGAHSRSLKKDIDLALECGAKFIGIFYCVSDERLSTVFKTDLSSAAARIEEAVSYAKAQNPGVIVRFTPEDTVRSEFGNVLTVAAAAVEAGADIISVADTTGYMMPRSDRSMYDYISRLKDAFAQRGISPRIAVHCHNVRGLALANALEGYRAGADIIDASVLGLGERAGIVDLASLLALLTQGYETQSAWNLTQIMPLYDLVSRYSEVPVPVNFPIAGRNAFKHCAGVHTHAAQVNPLHYQSLDPAPFGRSMEISLDQMSGISSIRYALEKIGVDSSDSDFADMALRRVKAIGQTGRTVDLEELSLIVEYVNHLSREKIDED